MHRVLRLGNIGIRLSVELSWMNSLRMAENKIRLVHRLNWDFLLTLSAIPVCLCAMNLVTTTDLSAANQIEYSGKYSYKCHRIWFSKRMMSDILLDSDHQWHLHLSSLLFKNIKTVAPEVSLYIGRKGKKGKQFSAKVEGQNLYMSLGKNQKFIDSLAADGWLGYRIGKKGQIRRTKIPDARNTIREIKSHCRKV